MRHVLLVALCLSLAGCSSGGGEPLSQAEAEAVADAAIEALASDMASGGGTIKRLSAELEVEDESFGAGDISMVIEFGLQGTSAVQATVKTGGFSVEFSMECGVDRQVIKFGGERLEARPGDDCRDMLSSDDELTGEFGFTDLDGLTRLNVTPLPDGGVRAVYEADGTEMTMSINPAGHITRMRLDGPDVTGTVDIDRGARSVIDPAPADDKMPTSASAWCFYFDGACDADVTDGDDAPLSEFEVRVYAQSDEPGQDAPVAVIPLAGGSSGGYTVAYVDDGDGLFGDGDSFTVTGPDQDVQVIIWDLWADKDIDDVGIPGPGIGFLLLGLVAFAVQRRAGKP